MGGVLSTSTKSYMAPGALFGGISEVKDKSSLFEMVYEKKPAHNQADYRFVNAEISNSIIIGYFSN